MDEYVKLLLDRCPSFRQYLEEQRLAVGEKDRLRYVERRRIFSTLAGRPVSVCPLFFHT